MNRRVVQSIVGWALVVSALAFVGHTSQAKDGGPEVPRAMAAVGDSLSMGFGCGFSCAWTTGTAVQSHAVRLSNLGAPVASFNAAVPGAPVASFAGQAASIVANQPGTDYVTVLFGGNDLCNPVGGVATPAAEFRQQFRAGLRTLQRGLDDVQILVVSLPDVASMQQAMLDAGRPGTSIYCRRYFDNPRSTDPADVARRAQVLAELEQFNSIMAQECARVRGCRSDGGALHAHRWVSAEISGDGIHPTTVGQAMVAEVTWAAGFRWDTAAEAD